MEADHDHDLAAGLLDGTEGLTTSLAAFRDAWELYAPGVWASVVLGAVLGMIGVYIVLRRLVFMSAALGQASSLGVVVALFFGASLSGDRDVGGPVLGAFTAGFIAALAVAGRRRGAGVERDGLLGAIYLVGAAGTLMLGSRLAHEMHEIEALLHGVGVAVMPEDLELALWLAGGVVLLQGSAWRAFAGVAFDPVGAAVRKVPTRLVEVLMALTVAAAFAVGIRALGALPVFALSVVPALAAIRLAPTLPLAFVVAVGFGAASGYLGYALAFVLDAPVGASQTVVALVLTGGALGARRLAQGWTRALPAQGEATRPALRRALIWGLGCGGFVATLWAGQAEVVEPAAWIISGLLLVGVVTRAGSRLLLGLAAVSGMAWLLAGAAAGEGWPELVRGLVPGWLALVGVEHLRWMRASS